MNNLTDAEIEKALECCISDVAHCFECPYNDNAECNFILIRNSFNYINRLKAENERFRKLQKPTGAGGYKIENGKVIYYTDILNGYRHEYKDLEEIVKELNLYMHTDYKNIELISHYQHKAQTAKAEAIKEFAERLKEKSEYYSDLPFKTVHVEDIDNLVKEMTEKE